ncbi:hypothetical protein GOP47_0029921 [Adiantum capillus-veneris]|nr:hypothetical protein GOP47_0029921 [Adiantum capillus-veneris]
MAAGSPKFFQEMKDFDEDLALRLENLNPKEGDDTKVLRLSWLSSALALALDKHIEAVNLIPPLDFPLLVCDEKWMNDYMDQTARMLDVCNALCGALSNIEQGHLLIRHACHVLVDAENAPLKQERESSDVQMLEDQLARAFRSLQEWVNMQVLSGPSTPKQTCIFQDMIKDLRPPSERDLRKGKGFLHALYGANTAAVFAFYVLGLALLQEGELLSFAWTISPTVSWSASILHLVQAAKEEAKEKKSSNVWFEELGALESSVKGLLGFIERALESKESPLSEGATAILARAVNDLCLQMDDIAKGLELLGTKLNEMFKAIVASRSVLLDRLGDFGTENL